MTTNRTEQHKNWYASTLEGKLAKIENTHRQRVGYLTPADNLTVDDLLDLFDAQHGVCALCGDELGEITEFKWTFDHIYPASEGGSLCYENGQILCPHCNSKKHTKRIIGLFTITSSDKSE